MGVSCFSKGWQRYGTLEMVAGSIENSEVEVYDFGKTFVPLTSIEKLTFTEASMVIDTEQYFSKLNSAARMALAGSIFPSKKILTWISLKGFASLT